MSLSVAATLLLATSVFVLFGWGSSVETYAAQLAVDHLKCFQFPPDAGAADPLALGRSWQATNGWPLRIAPGAKAEQLELLGVRRCGSTRGRVAHVLYRWHGEPVSLYVLNGKVDRVIDASHSPDAHDSVTRLGERAIIWFDKGRTYAIVARQQIPDLDRIAGYVRRAIE